MTGDFPAVLVRSAVEVQKALSTDAAWLWWRDPAWAGAPEEGALAALCAAVRGTFAERSPVIAASVLIDSQGAVLGPRFEPRYNDLVDLARGAEMQLLPVRAVDTASVLVHRRAFERHGIPRPALGRHGGLEWTARVLADEVACIAGASLVRVSAVVLPRSAVFTEWRVIAGVARAGMWGRGRALRAVTQAGLGAVRPGR